MQPLPTHTWLIPAGNFRSPSKVFLRILPISTPVGGGCAACSSGAPAQPPEGFSESEYLGVVVDSGDIIGLASGEACRSSDSTLGLKVATVVEA